MDCDWHRLMRLLLELEPEDVKLFLKLLLKMVAKDGEEEEEEEGASPS